MSYLTFSLPVYDFLRIDCVGAEPEIMASQENVPEPTNTKATLQTLTGKLQGRITTQGDPCNHYRE